MGRRGSSTDGKKFETWEIWKDREHVKVEVRMKHSATTILFSAECPQFDMKWEARGDVNQLRNTVEADIAAHNVIEYEPKIEVIFQIKPYHYDRNNIDGDITDPEVITGTKHEELDFKVEFFLLSTKKVKTEIDRYFGHKPRDLYYQKATITSNAETYYLPEDDDKDDPDLGDDEKVMRILLPDTLENRIALQEICNGMVRLRTRMAELLEPAKIKYTIKAINAGLPLGLLPPAKDSK